MQGEPVVLGLMLFSAIPSVLIMPFAHGLMPVYAGEVFDVGPGTLGLLMSAVGAGSLIGTLVLASIGELKQRGRVIVISIAFTGHLPFPSSPVARPA